MRRQDTGKTPYDSRDSIENEVRPGKKWGGI